MTHPYQRRTLGVLSAAQVVGGIGNGAGLAVGSLIAKDVSGSAAWAGMAVVMITLGAAAFTIPLARLAITYGRRPALALGWLAGALGAAVTVVGSEADSLAVTLVGLGLFGASTAANLQSRFAAVDLADAAQIGRSLSLVVWSTTIGAVIGPNLTGPGATLASALDLPELAGPMIFSAASFFLAGLLTNILLRPDPLLTATQARPAGTPASSGLRGVGAHLRGSTLAGVVTVCSAHAVMVAVMAMTPVHMQDHGSSLNIIGLTISLHIAGMFAFSPAMGWLNDRWGSARTIVMGQAVLLIAVLVAGTSGRSETQITVGLVLLGLGWSASLIAGSALLNQDLTAQSRPAVQGFSDLAMNLSGAAGGLLAGLVVSGWGFGTLNAGAAVLTLPVLLVMMSNRRQSVQSKDYR